MRLEDRQRVLPHLDELRLAVRIVGPVGVRRMVEERHDPPLIRRPEVGVEPAQHGARRRAGALVRVQHHEVNRAPVERVVRLGARGQPARPPVGGQHVGVVVGPRLRRGVRARAFVVAERRPHRGVPQDVGVDLEEARVELGDGAGVVGHVPEVKEQIRRAVGAGPEHRVAHLTLPRASGAGIAQDPEPERRARAPRRRRTKPISRGGRGRAGRLPHGVGVRGVGDESVEPDRVIERGRAASRAERQRPARGSETHPRRGRRRRPPDHVDGALRLALQVRRSRRLRACDAGRKDGRCARGHDCEPAP